jgi:hypothetical protein
MSWHYQLSGTAEPMAKSGMQCMKKLAKLTPTVERRNSQGEDKEDIKCDAPHWKSLTASRSWRRGLAAASVCRIENGEKKPPRD